MAIYHLHAKLIQRSKGKSAIAAAAYRHATLMRSEAENKTYNYSNKPDVIHVEILIPENAPEWLQAFRPVDAANRRAVNAASERLWNLTEAIEKRVDSQLARDIEFALPLELTQSQNIALVREFLHDQFVLRGMVADFAIHWDAGNPHAHVLLSTREITADGFGKKVPAWNGRQLFRTWREKWAEYANFHLRLHAHAVRIDHRSYEAQGIELLPGVHQGKAATDMERRGLATDILSDANAVRRENLHRIAEKPERLLDKLSAQQDDFSLQQMGHALGSYINDKGHFSYAEKCRMAEIALSGLSGLSDLTELPKQIESATALTPEMVVAIFEGIEEHESVFTDRDLAKALSTHTDNAEMFAKAVLEIKSSPELIALGPGDDGRARYTTRTMFDVENALQTQADILRDRPHVKLSSQRTESTLSRYQTETGKTLTDEQRIAVMHMLKPNSIACVVGRAGAGKSFSLGAAKVVWEAERLTVLGVALSGIAADGLMKDANIPSSTIESFCYQLKQGNIVLNHHTVVVMDEAGMTDSRSMHKVIHAIQQARAKLVLVGDSAQLQPVGPGASFRALLERLGFVEIQTVYRQKHAWQKEATVDFSSGNAREALARYSKQGCVHLSLTPTTAMDRLVLDWEKQRGSGTADLSQYLVVAHRNADVRALNQRLREKRIAQNEISLGGTVQSASGPIALSEGDRILFLKNDASLGVKNGRFGTVLSMTSHSTPSLATTTAGADEKQHITQFDVCLDGTGEIVTVNPNEYNAFALGYAATVHKVQGMTVDNTFVYADGHGWNRHLTYVAMSRHRESCHLYANQETHANEKALFKQLGRLGLKDSLLDYPLAFAERRGIDTTFLERFLPRQLAKRLSALKARLERRLNLSIGPHAVHAREAKQFLQHLKATKLTETRNDAKTVASYVDANQAVGKAWQTLQQKLDAMGLEALDTAAVTAVGHTIEFNAFQKAQADRNALAATIMKEPGRYEKALSIYELTHDKLQKEAAQHASLVRVQTYATLKRSGNTVLRDKIAADIQASIKAHWPHLNACAVDTKRLRKEALAHRRRQTLAKLSPKERTPFYAIEHYQTAAQAVGQHYADTIKDKPVVARRHAIGLEQLTRERDTLAHHILSDRSTYDTALDFYQIGLTPTVLLQSSTPEAQQHAQARWYRLQGHAASHDHRDRITRYLAACQQGQTATRLTLATEIRQNTKGHYAAMMQLGCPPDKTFWLQVWQDAQHAERLAHVKTLDLVERAAFLSVEDYVNAKRAHATAWRELFESKKLQGLDDAAFYQRMAGFAAPYTQLRNQLAADIAAGPALYQASLDYFKLSAEELNNQAFAYQCQQRVAKFTKANTVLERSMLAARIIEHPKAHATAMREHGVPWKNVYLHARIAERKALFTNATPEEKALLRLTHRYQTANRAVGKYYGQMKARTHNHSAKTHSESSRLLWLKAKRDAQAFRLHSKHELNPMLELPVKHAEANTQHIGNTAHLDWSKIATQARSHQDKLEAVANWHADYQASLTHLADIATQGHSGHAKPSLNRLMDWSVTHDDRQIDTFTQTLLNNAPAYQAALQEAGIQKNTLKQQQQAVLKLKTTLNEWLSLAAETTQVPDKMQSTLRTPDEQHRIDTVKRIVRGARPVAGTMAERYCREHRGITCELNPKTFLYHPGLMNWMTRTAHPALILVARDDKQAICGLQAIFLDASTAKKAPLGNYTKLSRGKVGEGALIQQGTPNGKIAFAEGPETALSIASAKPDWTVYVTFGVRNFDKVPLKTRASEIILCADNDGPGSGTEKAVDDAANTLSQHGIDVHVALPSKPPQYKKWDFNDALVQQGVSNVIQCLDNATLMKQGKTIERLEAATLQALQTITEPNTAEIQSEEIPLLHRYDKTDLLMRYVQMELEQTQLVNAMHEAKLNQPTEAKALSVKSIQHSQGLSIFAAELSQHPAFAEEMKTIRPLSLSALANRGGYQDIQTRFANGEFAKDDVHAVLAHIRHKALRQSQSQSHDRDRGGRKK